MCNPFGGGGGGSTQSTTTTTTNSSTNVSTTSNVSVPISVDTHDLATALQALAEGNVASAALTAGATVSAAKAGAIGQVAAAQIGAGPSWSTIIYVGAAVIGALVALHVIKVRGFK